MSEVDVYRLTPRETWRLMGFSDEDFEKAEKAQNGAQGHLYKQAGNSICVKVLETVFKEMLGEQKTEMNERIIESEIRLQRDKEIAEIIEDLFKPGAESDYDKGFNEALMLIHDKVMC